MERQEIEEAQQTELRTWRDMAQKARIARQRVQAKLQTLSPTARQPTKIDPSFAAAKATLASSIDQLIFLLEARKRKFVSSERQLSNRLHGYEVEKQNHRRWAVEDIKLILQGTVKPFDISCSISSVTDLVEQCAANNKLAKYYSEAFGQFILLLAAVCTVFHLPLGNHFIYQGNHSQIWSPSAFFDYTPEQRSTTPHVLCLTAPSGSSSLAEIHQKEVLQAFEFLERSVAVAVSARPELVLGRSVVGTPLEWIAELCKAAMQERRPQKGGSTRLKQSVLVVNKREEADETAEEEKEIEETLNAVVNIEETDGDWELLKAADAEAAIEIQSASTIASLLSMVDKVKTIAYSYTAR